MAQGAQPGVAATPAFTPHRWNAPESWRVIDLLSDLHLDAQMPGTTAALAAFLRSTPADAVLILGDLFEAWVGDDAATLPGFAEVTAAIRATVERGVAVALMVGNRDFLVGRDWHVAAGTFSLPDPTIAAAFEGQRVLLTHGDVLCLSDTFYQAFRAQSRDPRWQAELLAKQLDERLRIAASLRAASREHQASPMAASMDLDADAVDDWLAKAQCGVMIHGHTHHPARHRLNAGRERWVLSDWDFEMGSRDAPRGDILRWTAKGLQRLAVAADGSTHPTGEPSLLADSA